jgi:hypothetical protein
MSETIHTKARALLHESLVEGISGADQRWLQQHFSECLDCAKQADAMREMLGALRAVPVETPRDLATRTQLRVRLRAQEAPVTGVGVWLWVVTAASWALGVLSAPLVWRLFSWAGERFGAPKLAVEVGFGLWWLLPAVVALAAVLHHKTVAPAAGEPR